MRAKAAAYLSRSAINCNPLIVEASDANGSTGSVHLHASRAISLPLPEARARPCGRRDSSPRASALQESHRRAASSARRSKKSSERFAATRTIASYGRIVPRGSSSTTRSFAAILPSLENAVITSTSRVATASYMKVDWNSRRLANASPYPSLSAGHSGRAKNSKSAPMVSASSAPRDLPWTGCRARRLGRAASRARRRCRSRVRRASRYRARDRASHSFAGADTSRPMKRPMPTSGQLA